MPITLTTKGKQPILVEDTPLADGVGGEGAVHRIISPSWYEGHCVKIYFEKFRKRARERKLDFMLKQSLPSMDKLRTGGCIIGWPKELIYQNNRFAGFLMPLGFNGSYQLYELCAPQMRKLSSVWQSRYDRSSSKGIESRLKLCVNIASAFTLIHGMSKYVLVDLKPQNILVTSDGKVSVIDLDSIQIAENNRVVFPAQVATPEYVPVEGNHLNPATDLIPESWDRFSLAVVFYQLLFGLHPYAASYQGAYQNSNSVPESIKNGLFVFGSKRNYVHIKPPLHDNFARIPSSLQTLFLKAFDAGHNNPALRPKAEEWGRTIYMELKDSARQLQGFSKTIPAQPMKKASTVNVNYADTRQQQRWAAKTATTTPTPPAAKTPPAPVVTPKKSLPIGKIVRWAMALCVFFFIVLPVLRGLINFVNSRARSRSSSSNPRASSACQQGSTGYLTTNVKLRYNPGTDYKQLAVHYKGAKVQILETRQGEYSRGNNYWYRIRVLNKGCHAELPNVCGSEGSAMEGWIHSLLVTCN